MRRSRRSRDAASVSLFPFLAVLLCTMGALIVLLIVIAQQAKSQTSDPIEQPDPAEAKLQAQLLAQRKAEKDRLVEQADQFRSLLDEGVATLKAKQRSVIRLQNELGRALHEADQILAEEQDLTRAANEDHQADPLQDESADLDWRIREARKALRDSKQKASQPRELYSIIPYAGRHGVARRPIYIECRADRIILQPEGVELKTSDFDVLARGNPLESALRVTAHHWQRSGEESGNPYPLLLVRPDGVMHYHAARSAMLTWGGEFGYELIDKDWSLDFPNRDPQLAQAQQTAIEAARRRMAKLAQIQKRRGRSIPEFKISQFGTLEPNGLADSISEQDRFGQSLRKNNALDSTRPSRSKLRHNDSDNPSGTKFGQSGADVSPLLKPSGSSRGDGSSEGSEDQTANPGDSSVARSGEFSASSATRNGTGGPAIQPPRNSGSPGIRSAGPGGPAGSSSPCVSIAARQGANWALPTQPGRRSWPFRRKVRLLIDGDMLTVFADPRASRTLQVIRLTQNTDDSIDELKTAVWKLMQDWGAAPQGYHWRPMLWAHVTPRGARRFHELGTLLRDSGFELYHDSSPLFSHGTQTNRRRRGVQ